ncbi:MAG: hypothetical protein HC852_04530 [Acaryochloridaceae cyanobacterium RU_4_10]|nr:hypothetical protein [Acaryochloridaceae cyanobacterium RU_4_10]
MASMIDASTVANAKTERRVELNRSLDFISNEVRKASSLVENAEGAADPASFSTPGATSPTKVLMLNLPNAAAPVVYYVAQPSSGNWSGPRVVYRWGPKFDAMVTTRTWEIHLLGKVSL